MRIRTRSRSDAGFRRAGVRHTPEPQIFPGDAFTPEQIDQLLKDPELVVDVLEDEAAGGGPKVEDGEEAKKPSGKGK